MFTDVFVKCLFDALIPQYIYNVPIFCINNLSFQRKWIDIFSKESYRVKRKVIICKIFALNTSVRNV